MYAGDFDADKLITQLAVLRQQVAPGGTDGDSLTMEAVVKAITKTPNFNTFLSEVVKLTELVLVAAATNATSERSFSALRRVKTYLRTTMSQTRLNHLLILHVHKEACDNLDLVQVAGDFTKDSEHRHQIFGHFQWQVAKHLGTDSELY